ncbi:SIS domain-containing protein [Actinorugispora endophytica]|uniref:SIS domain-containing protein n=1 Tax=Actinorugispora endophytica TaxID=1605990 RepID=A0A4R6UNV5_9ACTN|nr:SIS domain-containing protein [Actinorugispora endophytica]TDQ48512.1 SIS domain-containing protein [Actinorugispora endophytica]
MTAKRLVAELSGKAAALTRLADQLPRRDPYAALPSLMADEPAAIVLLGVGAGYYACQAAAGRMRRAGLGASAESATAAFSTPGGPDTLVVAVALGSGRRELCEALERYARSSAIIVLTDEPESPEARYADVVVPLMADPDGSGLECVAYQQALALLLVLAARLGASTPGVATPSATLRRAANAVTDLLARASVWVPEATGVLAGRDGLALVAPAERLSSARFDALALRRGPVLAAHACETGEWSHTDRYLAAIQDYRALLFTGSRFDERFAEHLGALGGSFVAVGAEVPGAAMSLRYPGDGDPDVSLLAEPVVGELLALRWWAKRRED